MADAFTSIATTPGYGSNTVTLAYDLAFRKALIAQPAMRQFADVRVQNPSHRGSSYRIQLDQPFSEAVVTAAKTPLNEESDADTVKMPATNYVDLQAYEQGFMTKRTIKLVNRAMVTVDDAIAWAVADNCNKVLDEIIQDRLEAGAATGNKLYGTGSTVGAQTNAAVLTADLVRKAVLKLRVAQSLPTVASPNLYTGIVHPNALYDLRRETGSGGWRVPNEYGTSQTDIWNGTIGDFEGVRFVETPRTRTAPDGASSAITHRSYFLGREALAELAVVEPHFVVGPYTDNFMRFRKAGWYADIGWGVFRQESLVMAYTGSQGNV